MNGRLSIAAVALLVLSCGKQEEKRTDIITFPLRGEVVAIDTAAMRLTVTHEEIPDYMEAMTMPFKVKNLELLRAVQIGDTIQGVLAVSRTESWLETFTVAGRGSPPDPGRVGDAILARMFKAGDLLPDITLTNQAGAPIRFRDFRGRVLAFTFIYTRCPLPDFCIRMSNFFAQVQKLLQRDRALDGMWHLLSVSFDPAFDTPAVLKEYGRTYGADFKTWDFATADQRTLIALTDGLGLTIAAEESGLIAHNLRTVVLDREGRISLILSGNEWTPEELLAAIKDVAGQP